MEKTVADILEIAIKREEAAYDFYMDIHSKVQDASVQDTVQFIAREEKQHKAFLVAYRDGEYGSQALRMTDVVEYKIAEYLEEPEISKDSKPEDVYLVAAHRDSSFLLGGVTRNYGAGHRLGQGAHFVLEGDAPAEKLQEVVEQSRRRSAVYDVMTNGIPVEITAECK